MAVSVECAARVGLMKKEMNELPPEVQARIRALEALPEDQINTTDAPEILDWSDARRGVFYRPSRAAPRKNDDRS